MHFPKRKQWNDLEVDTVSSFSGDMQWVKETASIQDFLIETLAGKFLVWDQPSRNKCRGRKLLCYEVNIVLWDIWMKQYENLKGSQDQWVPVNWKIVHKNYFRILDSAQKVKPKGSFETMIQKYILAKRLQTSRISR